MKIASGVSFAHAHTHLSPKRAEAEGWALTRGAGGRAAIVRTDERFATDADALNHVMRCAWRGSPLHDAALFTAHRADPENTTIAAYVAAVRDALEERAFRRARATDQDVAAPFRLGIARDPEMHAAWSRVRSAIGEILDGHDYGRGVSPIGISAIRTTNIENFKHAFALACADGGSPDVVASRLLDSVDTAPRARPSEAPAFF